MYSVLCKAEVLLARFDVSVSEREGREEMKGWVGKAEQRSDA